MTIFNPNILTTRKLGQFFDSNTKTQQVTRKQKVDQFSEVDHVPTNTRSFQGESQFYIFEDNEAVIKMVIRRRSPTTCVENSQSRS